MIVAPEPGESEKDFTTRVNSLYELLYGLAPNEEAHESIEEIADRISSRAYCPNGEGGGVTNDCGKGEQPARTPSGKLKLSKEEKTELKAKLRELPQDIPIGHEALVRTKPFVPSQGTKNSDFTKVPSDDSLKEAMGKNALAPADKTISGMSISKGESYIGFHRDLPEGTPVAFRIDIPTFNNSSRKGAPVYSVTIHEDSGRGSKEVGDRMGHDGIARMTGPVQFKPDSVGALDIAGGAENKYPAATVKGKFDPSRGVPSDIDEWTPVGFDPEKASYFYDKKTGQEVTGGTDAVSTGNTVFTRQPKYGSRNAKTHYRSLDEMMAVDSWGLESRAFCATGDGGGIDNSCSPSAEAAAHLQSVSRDADSVQSLQSEIEKVIGTKVSFLGKREGGDASPSEAAKALGLNISNIDEIDEIHSSGTQRDRVAIAGVLARMHFANQVDPSLLKTASVRIDTAESFTKHSGISSGDFKAKTAVALYVPDSDTIYLFAGGARSYAPTDNGLTPEENSYASGFSSTMSPASTLIHENAHRTHFQSLFKAAGLSSDMKTAKNDSERIELASQAYDFAISSLKESYDKDPKWRSRVDEKVQGVSAYASADPIEAVAEYTAAVRLGHMKNDPDLDKFCRVVKAPVPKAIKGASKLIEKWRTK